MDKRKMIIRIGRNTLSFTMPNLSDNERPYIHEPYTVKGGISMAANLREAFKTADLMAIDTRRAQVLIDTPSMLVPVEQFEEDSIVTIFNHTFPSGDEQRTILYNVLPNLKSVCLFAINRDLRGVLCDKFDDVVFIYAVEFQVEVCQLVACVERRAASVAFDLPDLSDETDKPINYNLYAIVEAANTACVSTLSPDEKKADKSHRNINRRVSPSIFIGTITVGSDS